MYNVKIIKYPAGWQVRVYSTLVGVNTQPDGYLETAKADARLQSVMEWDTELQTWIRGMADPDDYWLNPFTHEIEKAPVPFDGEEEEEDMNFKKARSIRVSLARTVNAIYHISRSNTWDWFVTLTFDPAKVDSLDYQETVKKLSQWLNNCRKLCPDMGYIVVPEMHKSGRFHFHGLFRSCDGLGFIPSGKVTGKGQTIYNIGRYRLGWTTATRVEDNARVTKYMSKYISKDLCQVAFGKKRYWNSKNLASADCQEVILDHGKLQALSCRLKSHATHVKHIGEGDMQVTYYELPEEVTENAEDFI